MSISLFDDRFEPIAGGLARVSIPGGDALIQVTDAMGEGSWRPLELGASLEITLADHLGPTGLALGLTFTDLPPSFQQPGADARWLKLAFTQPLAVGLPVAGGQASSRDHYPTDGAFPFYGLHTPQGSALRFRPLVAYLKDGAEVASYLRYRGRPAQDSDYAAGLVLVTPEIDFGGPSSANGGGLSASLRLMGELPASTAQIDLCEILSPSATPGSGPVSSLPLTAEITKRSTDYDVLVVRLNGRFPGGQIAILLRKQIQTPAGKHTWIDAPPNLAIPPDAGGGTASLDPSDDCAGCGAASAGPESEAISSGLVTNCEPPVPNMPPGWSCDPPAPESDCPISPVGQPACQLKRFRSPRVCLSAGQNFEVEEAVRIQFKLSFEIGSEAGLGGQTSFQTGSGFEYGFEQSVKVKVNWTAQPGSHGLGQCSRWFRFYLVCVQAFGTQSFGHEDHGDYTVLHPCHTPVTRKASCMDQDFSSSVCDRTP